jgi:hypothetical protein
MAITGTHMLLYTPEPEGVRSTLRDVFGLDHVDAGEGWLIFKLPPAEVGVHPSDGETTHALSFLCDDIEATMVELAAKGITFSGPPDDQGYGIMTMMQLPGGLRVQLYQPRHPTAI